MFKHQITQRKFVFGFTLRPIRWILLLFLLMMLGAVESRAQVDENYSITVGTFQGLPGDTVYMPFYLRNYNPNDLDDGEVGALVFRFVYDYEATFTDLLAPLFYYKDTVVNNTVVPPDTQMQYYFEIRTAGRGNGLWVWEDPGNPFDSSLNLFCYHVPIADSIADTMIIRYSPPIIFDPLVQKPYIEPSGPDSSKVMEVPFIVNENASFGDYTRIVFRDDQFGFVDNQLSDTLGSAFIHPVLNNSNFFVVGEIDPCDTCTYGCCDGVCCDPPPPDNHDPVVSLPSQTVYDIEQGQNVSFNVTASDEDNDDEVCLQPTSLPANAVFTPSNPICGTGVTVTGTFSWTPSFGQEGTFTVVFRANDDHGATDNGTVVINVTKIEKDRLFTTSTYGAHPTGGVPGAYPVPFPIDLASTKTVYGIQFDMTYPDQIAFLDSITVTDRIPDYVIYDNIGQYPDSIRVVAFGLNNEPVVTGSSSAILNAWYTIDSAALPGDYWVRFFDAWESINPDPEVPSDFLEVDSGIIQVDMYGDVNLDQHIDVADLVNIVASIIGTYELPKRNFETADIVLDMVVNVVDLIGIVNMIFDVPIDPTPAPSGSPTASLKIVHDDLLAGQLTKLNVQGEFPENVAGVELQIDYDPISLTLDNPEMPDGLDNFSLRYKDDGQGRMKVVLYSNRPWIEETQISQGVAEVLRLPANIKKDIKANDESKIRITRAYLSGGTANEIAVEGEQYLLPTTFKLKQNYPNPFNPNTRIEFEIGSESGALKHVRLDVFNILGQKVNTLLDDHLGNGIYSVDWNSTNEAGGKVATGVYLYRLSVDDLSSTKKMMLLK